MTVDIKRYNIPNNEREEAIMNRDRANRKLLVLEVNMCSLINPQNQSLITRESVAILRIRAVPLFVQYKTSDQTARTKRIMWPLYRTPACRQLSILACFVHCKKLSVSLPVCTMRCHKTGINQALGINGRPNQKICLTTPKGYKRSYTNKR